MTILRTREALDASEEVTARAISEVVPRFQEAFGNDRGAQMFNALAAAYDASNRLASGVEVKD